MGESLLLAEGRILMQATSVGYKPEGSKAYRAILAGGFIAGVLDITAACINARLRSGSSPVRVFQSVAGGLFGAETFNGGLKTAALGLALHFLIATTAAAVYYAASRKLSFLVRQPWFSGPLYGVAVYVWMYMVVLPLSAWQFKFFNQPVAVIVTGLLIHICCIGLPIAFVVRQYSR